MNEIPVTCSGIYLFGKRPAKNYEKVDYLADFPKEIDDFINAPIVVTPLWKIALEDFLSLFSSKKDAESMTYTQWIPKRHWHLLYWC